MASQRPVRSVQYSLLFWNAGLLAICLLAFCTFFHELLRVRLLSLVDTQLTQRSNGLIRLWASVPEVAQEALREELNSGRLASTMFIPEQQATPASLPTTAPDASLTGILRPRAFSPDGKSYFRGVNDSMLDAAAFARAAKGETVHSTVTIRGSSVRVISVPVIVDGDVEFVLQAARGLTEYQAELRAVTVDLLRAIPLLLIFAAIGGWLLTHRAMRPVRDLRQATEHIEARDLAQRLPVVGHDEFTLLTETLNHMLSRLQTAFEHQSRFIADASHELRTPLTVLRGNTSLALQGERTAADYRTSIERVHRSVDTMGRLVDELLLLSRADSGQMLYSIERVNLADVIEAAVEATPGRDLAPIQVEWTAGEPAGKTQRAPGVRRVFAELFVNGSADLLTRLIANLLSNAVRHTESEGPITVSAYREGSSAIVSVQDSGEGIAPEHLNHVTERFYRSDKARSGQGSGLGLAICQSIVDAHDGEMRIESTVGVGTKVTVRLNLA